MMSNGRTASRRWLLLPSTLFAITLLGGSARAQAFHVERLRTEYATNPIGIDEPAPRPAVSPFDPAFNPHSIKRSEAIGDGIKKTLDRLDQTKTRFVT